MVGPVRRRLVGLLGVAFISVVPVVVSAPAGQAADPSVPVITSASLKITGHYLTPTTTTDQNPDIGVLTLHIEMPSAGSGISSVDARFGAPKQGCYEGVYEPKLAGSVTQAGTHATVVMPIAACGTLYEDSPEFPGAYELGLDDPRSGAFLGAVYVGWGDDAPHRNWLAAPASVTHFHIWSVTLISESTSLTTIKGVRYRNLAGVLQRWDAPNQRWRRFGGATVRLYFTPPGGTRRWVATKDTASDGSYHFRTSNTKPGTWRIYFRTTVHYWTSSRSLTVR